MQILFSLEPTDIDDPLDIDPLGDITLLEGEEKLTESSVYLDSWFNAIEKGAVKIENESKAEIDLIEEPQPLIFNRSSSGVRISFKEKSLTIKNMDDLRTAVKRAREELISTQVFPTGYGSRPK